STRSLRSTRAGTMSRTRSRADEGCCGAMAYPFLLGWPFMWISVLRRLHPKRRSIGRCGGWRRRGSPPPAFRAWYLAVEARRNDHAPGWARQFLGLDVSLAPLARLAQNEERGCTGSDTGGRGRLGPMMSSINDVAKLYDEFEEAFVDVMTAKSEGLSF